MKKFALLSLFFAAPAFGWELNSLWKPATETIQNAWQSMSPTMQKVTIAAGVAATVYAAWPIKKQAAYEKSEQYAKVQQDKIDSGVLTAEQIAKLKKERKHIVAFKYGFFWQNQKYQVSTYMTKSNRRTLPTIKINDWANDESITYLKGFQAGTPWSRSATENFFTDIKDIESKLN